MSVSLDPPLVAFCVGRSSLTWRRMRRSAHLGINVLDSSVDDVRDRARPGADRLAGLDVRIDAHGVPRLTQATAFLLADVVDERAVGDHALVTCAVLEADCDDSRRPLVFFGGGSATVLRRLRYLARCPCLGFHGRARPPSGWTPAVGRRSRATCPQAHMRAKKRPAFAGLFRAAEGTRTLDLLHGKQTL